MSEETQLYQLENIIPRCRDPKDDYLLELAIVSKADYLVTGDKDLLDLDKIGYCQISFQDDMNTNVSIKNFTIAIQNLYRQVTEGLQMVRNYVVD